MLLKRYGGSTNSRTGLPERPFAQAYAAWEAHLLTCAYMGVGNRTVHITTGVE